MKILAQGSNRRPWAELPRRYHGRMDKNIVALTLAALVAGLAAALSSETPEAVV